MDPSTSSPASAIEAALNSAWVFLSGQERRFRVLDRAYEPSQGHVGRLVLLPISMRHEMREGGVVMEIDRNDAEKIASFMFSSAPDELSEDDITDACLEACNVLSSSLIGLLCDRRQAEIGMPLVLGEKEYKKISDHGDLKYVAEGLADHHRLVLMVFDRFGSPGIIGGDNAALYCGR